MPNFSSDYNISSEYPRTLPDIVLAVEAVASEAVSALQKPRNPEKQGIFALAGLEIAARMRKLYAVPVAYARFGPKINREF